MIVSIVALIMSIASLTFAVVQYRAAVNVRRDSRVARNAAERAAMRTAAYVDEVRMMRAELKPPF